MATSTGSQPAAISFDACVCLDPYDDQREHRVVANQELAKILGKLEPRAALYFRMLAETGVRASEGLAVAAEAIHGTTLKVRRQLGPGGKLVPLKSRQSRREIEITRSLAAELRLAGGFQNTNYKAMLRDWTAATEAAGIERPYPVIRDLWVSLLAKWSNRAAATGER